MFRTIQKKVREIFRCLTHRCGYYTCYLTYGPPELTHEGYHAACRKYELAQKKLSDWYAAHPEGFPPEWMHQQAEVWEKRVRA